MVLCSSSKTNHFYIGDLHDVVQSLMCSAYASADNSALDIEISASLRPSTVKHTYARAYSGYREQGVIYKECGCLSITLRSSYTMSILIY
jgi:hypothetical protein